MVQAKDAMKKNRWRPIRLVGSGAALVMLLAAACNSEAQPQTSAEEELPAAVVIVQNNTSEEAAIPAEGLGSTKMIFGSFQLENTDLAITPEQAAEFVPLWKVYQTLLDSSTAAEAEREALLRQIEAVFTPEQKAYLESTTMDPEETDALLAELGIESQTGVGGGPGGGTGGEDLTDAEKAELQALREASGGGQGGGQGGGGGMGADMDPEQLATLQAERAENGGGIRGGGQMDELLLPALIELLESK